MKVVLVFFIFILTACNNSSAVPKPRAFLDLDYPPPQYSAVKTDCSFEFEINHQAVYTAMGNCESKLVYPNLRATVYLSYRPIRENLDSLLSDAYQMPSKHIIKATEIPEKVFINPQHQTYGTLFRIVGEAASQAQFFLTDSLNHFLVGSLYFYTRPNYDSIVPAARYVEQDLVKLMESLRWQN